MIKKLKIGVLMGGKSIEKEVSFNSGRTIADHIDSSKFSIIPIFQTESGKLFILPWKFLHRGKTIDFIHRLEKEAEYIKWNNLKEIIDFAYIAMHGRYAEDGTLQGMLEVLNIPYLGSNVFVSALCMDKILQRQWLQMHGIDIPKAVIVEVADIKNIKHCLSNVLAKLKKEKINFPVVVKPHKEGSSLGISVVKKEEELEYALNSACNIFKKTSQDVLIEEKLEGMEFSSIALIDNKTQKQLALPPTEIVNEEGKDIFDYEQKYMPGRAKKFTPARCSQEEIKKIQKACMATMQTLGIETIARIDGFLTKDGKVKIIDPNTLSGMGPSTFLFRQAAEVGMSHTDLINHLLETDLKRYGLVVKDKDNLEGEYKEKMKIAVLFGGNTNEREVSLESGRNVCYKLTSEKYSVVPIFVDSQFNLHKINNQLLVRNSTKEIEIGLSQNMQIYWDDLKEIADFVFIALHGGSGENGAVQGALEMLDMPYNGPGIFTSALCMDKFKTNNFLKAAGFTTPEARLINKIDWQNNKSQILDKFTNYPYIAKPHDDGCSVMVQKVKNRFDLDIAIEAVFNLNKNYVLVEEVIKGMELTVGVVGNNNPIALPPSQTIATKDILSMEEKFLPGAGENQTPALISKEAEKFVRTTIENVFKAVKGNGYSRIDCFYQSKEESKSGKEQVVILEINTLPALTPATCLFHQAAEVNIKPMEFVDLIVQLGLEKHSYKNAIITPIVTNATKSHEEFNITS